VPSVRRAKLPNRGVRETPVSTQVATRLLEGTGFCAANTVRLDTGKAASVSMRVQAVRCARSRDCGAVKLLSTQIVRKTGESNFISNGAACCMQCRRQRFPTVRTAGWLGNSEVTAKMRNIRACTSTEEWNRANSLEIHDGSLLKSRASRQEKASACNTNCATADEHFCHAAVFDGCADVNAAGT
jgi:hypothetical protein